jgi:hypothetical protein
MQIECTTTIAAGQVLFVLTDLQMQPGREFHIDGPCLPEPPIYFIVHAHLLAPVVRRLECITETVITNALGA